MRGADHLSFARSSESHFQPILEAECARDLPAHYFWIEPGLHGDGEGSCLSCLPRARVGGAAQHDRSWAPPKVRRERRNPEGDATGGCRQCELIADADVVFHSKLLRHGDPAATAEPRDCGGALTLDDLPIQK